MVSALVWQQRSPMRVIFEGLILKLIGKGLGGTCWCLDKRFGSFHASSNLAPFIREVMSFLSCHFVRILPAYSWLWPILPVSPAVSGFFYLVHETRDMPV